MRCKDGSANLLVDNALKSVRDGVSKAKLGDDQVRPAQPDPNRNSEQLFFELRQTKPQQQIQEMWTLHIRFCETDLPSEDLVEAMKQLLWKVVQKTTTAEVCGVWDDVTFKLGAEADQVPFVGILGKMWGSVW
mmetsp:Transcript_37347/g.86856  ORF Transcript_37347/g.86856 Transcript_37347/m.86856 type:complete len:133 (-) Transcript_37347:21-419(-)